MHQSKVKQVAGTQIWEDDSAANLPTRRAMQPPRIFASSLIVEQNPRAAPRANLSAIAPLATYLELQTKIWSNGISSTP